MWKLRLKCNFNLIAINSCLYALYWIHKEIKIVTEIQDKIFVSNSEEIMSGILE